MKWTYVSIQNILGHMGRAPESQCCWGNPSCGSNTHCLNPAVKVERNGLPTSWQATVTFSKKGMYLLSDSDSNNKPWAGSSGNLSQWASTKQRIIYLHQKHKMSLNTRTKTLSI